jgi:hypothetical protein
MRKIFVNLVRKYFIARRCIIFGGSECPEMSSFTGDLSIKILNTTRWY